MIVVSAKGLSPSGCDEITAKVFPSSEMSALWIRDWYRSVLVKTAPDLRFARYTFRGLSATGKDGHNGNSVGIFQFRCFAPGVRESLHSKAFSSLSGVCGTGLLYIHSPRPLRTGILSSAAHSSRCFRHRSASSLVTVRIHLVFGSDGSSLSSAGLSMNAEMLPQQMIIRLLVMGLFRAFSNLVSQRRFSALLLHLLVSLWSTTIVLLSGGP